MFGVEEQPKPISAHLVSCEACGHQVSASARSCPSCAHPLPKRGKSWWVTLLLLIPCANLGLHRFYTGNYLLGLFYLFTWGGFWIGGLVDLWLILTGGYRDGQDRRLLGGPTWAREGGPAGAVILAGVAVFIALAILGAILAPAPDTLPIEASTTLEATPP